MIGTAKMLAEVAGREKVGIGLYLYPDGENLMLTVKSGFGRLDCAYPVKTVEGTIGEGVLRACAEDCVKRLREKAEALKEQEKL